MKSRAFPLVLGLLAVTMPTLVRAESVQVLGYMRQQIQVFAADGTPESGLVPVSRLPKPPYVSNTSGPAKSVGLPLDGGRIVFVRRLDLKLGPTSCVKVAGNPARPGGSQQAGQRMGAGDSEDCLVQ